MKENRNDIIEKIRKILALAENNPNENEAISAALKAQELMAKFNINEAEIGNELSKERIDSLECVLSGKVQKWKLSLAVVISKNFRCKVYLTNNNVTFYGYESDIKIASEVFKSMYNIGVKLSNKEKLRYRKIYGTAKGVRNTFCNGFVNGIEKGLDRQCTALMIVIPKEVEKEFETKTNSFTSRPKNISLTISNDSELYNKGFEAGRDAINSRSIEGK